MRKLVVGLTALLVAGAAMPASAATYIVNFNSPKFGSAGPFIGSLTLTTADIAAADGSYAILKSTGSGTYKTKTYAFAGPTGDNGADNKLFADRTGQVLSLYGTSFALTATGSATLKANIFYYGSTTNAYMWAIGNDSGIFNTFTISQATSPVPEPAAWTMMIVGFGAVGAVLRLRREPRIGHAVLA